MKKLIITTGVIAVVGGVATAALVSSCDPACEPDPDKPALIISIVDQDVADGEARFVHADAVWGDWRDTETGEGSALAGTCRNGECSEWTLGAGQPGTYVFTATVCGEEFSSSVTIEAKEDGCDIDTQLVELPVDLSKCETPAPDLDVAAKCNPEPRVSVVAHVMTLIDDMLIPIGADRVFYSAGAQAEARELPGVCLDEACTQFAAGEDLPGHFTLGAEVCGETVTAETTVEMRADGCHVETQHVTLTVDATKCDSSAIDDVRAPELPEPTETCKPEIVSSAYIFPVDMHDDVYMPHGTNNLVYIHEGERYQGYCARENESGACTWWVTRWNQIGEFKAFTEACGVDTAVDFTVEARADGCYPKTEYVYVEVDTNGCIQAPSLGGNGSGGTHAAGTDVTSEPNDPTDVTRN